jgi:hypothetical protein
MATLYENEIMPKALRALTAILRANGDLHKLAPPITHLELDKSQSTHNANIVFTQHKEKWLNNSVCNDHFGLSRPRSLYIITPDPSAEVHSSIGAPAKYLGNVNVVFITLIGLIEQSRNQSQMRMMTPLNPRRIKSLQRRLQEQNGLHKPLSLAHLPVIIRGMPGAVGMPVGTVIRTANTLRVVQLGKHE